MTDPLFTITIDTREQKSPSFRGIPVDTEVDTVKAFDYCIKGDSEFAVERKGLDDFVNSITVSKNWEREIRKIEKAKDLFYDGAPLHYVIEGSLSDLTKKYNYDRRKITPAFTLSRARDIAWDHGVYVWFAEDKRTCADWIFRLLRRRWHMLKKENKGK